MKPGQNKSSDTLSSEQFVHNLIWISCECDSLIVHCWHNFVKTVFVKLFAYQKHDYFLSVISSNLKCCFFLKTLKVKINNTLNFDATNNVFGDQNEKSN